MPISLIILAQTAEKAAEHAAEHHGLINAEFWVAVAFIFLLGLMGWLGVHKAMGKALDARSDKIRAQLDEARLLKEEAQSTLAQLQRRQREAAAEAKEIIAHAQEEAVLVQKEMEENVEALISRRSQLAQDRIAQAEAAALKEVRAAAVEVATRAAAAVISQHLSGDKRKELVSGAIDELDRKLH